MNKYRKSLNYFMLAMFILYLVFTMSGCGAGDIKPVDGDNRTVNQMVNEVEHNLKDAPNNFGLNSVWTK